MAAKSKLLVVLTLAFVVLVETRVQLERDYTEGKKCKPITVPMCQGIGYNHTYTPNRFNHNTQEDAGLEVHQFWPLVEMECSPYLHFFLCSMYTPICLRDYHRPLPPCRSICLHAQQGCEPLMRRFGFRWPPKLNCDQLPEHPDESGGDPEMLCMAPPPGVIKTKKKKTKVKAAANEDLFKKLAKENNLDMVVQPGRYLPEPEVEIAVPKSSGGVRRIPSRNNIPFTTRVVTACTCECQPPLVEVPELPLSRVWNVSRCSLPCHSPLFSSGERGQEQHRFLELWLALWALPVCLITLFTVLTFVIDVDRFQYPERPIFFVAFCYLMVSLGVIIRLVAGHERTACGGLDVVGSRVNGVERPVCFVVFLLTYFFGMASAVWWVVLSFTWLLAAGLKWSSEAIAGYSGAFHAVAWLCPAVQTLAALFLSAIDGDPLSGLCGVGNTDANTLRWLVLGPLFTYLTLGLFFLVCGFFSLWRIRKFVKRQEGAGRIEKLDQLMARIGLFALLYVLPALGVVGVVFLEQSLRPQWERQMVCAPCGRRSTGSPRDPSAWRGLAYSLALLKHASSLVVGVTSGLWICSRKTLHTWRELLTRLCCCCVDGSKAQHRTPIHFSNTRYTPATHHQQQIFLDRKSHTDLSSSFTPNSRHAFNHL